MARRRGVCRTCRPSHHGPQSLPCTPHAPAWRSIGGQPQNLQKAEAQPHQHGGQHSGRRRDVVERQGQPECRGWLGCGSTGPDVSQRLGQASSRFWRQNMRPGPSAGGRSTTTEAAGGSCPGSRRPDNHAHPMDARGGMHLSTRPRWARLRSRAV
jgi:hypothetical protein